MYRWKVLAFIFFTLLMFPQRAAGQTANPNTSGPYNVTIVTETIAGAQTDIYFPSEQNGRYPTILMLHGLQGNKSNLKQIADQLASWGMILVVPDLSFSLMSSDSSTQKQLAVNIVNHIINQSTNGSSIFSHTDTNRLGLAGHSAGGNLALQIAATDRRIKVLVGMDAVIFAGPPWDTIQTWYPDSDASAISASTLLLEAPSQSCNADSNKGLNIYTYLTAPNKAKISIRNASHCDFMDAIIGCDLICGTSSDARRTIVRKYITAWFGYFLANRTDFYSYLFGQQAQADIQANLIRMESTLNQNPGKKPGDANKDNIVDGIDYTIWFKNYLRTTQNKEVDGDFNGNGKVDGVDYSIWFSNYLK